MNFKKRAKLKMRYAPRFLGTAPYRKDGTFFEDYCCNTCYWDWGHGFANQHRYKHSCTQSNYFGLLKKYWVSSAIDYSYDEDESEDNEIPQN